jgi:hypothetical protein
VRGSNRSGRNAEFPPHRSGDLETTIRLPKAIRERLVRLREKSFLLFIDHDGNVGARPMNRGGRRAKHIVPSGPRKRMAPPIHWIRRRWTPERRRR